MPLVPREKIDDVRERTNIVDICPGTAVTNSLSGYYSRPRTANDQHGLGTFLLMNEELTR